MAIERSRRMGLKFSKFTLLMHITFSVGWIGAVAGFLVLSIASLTSANPDIVRGAYLSMNVLGLYVIVPLSFVALLTGLVQSLGTSWGLFRQYWTLVKFGLTLGSVLILLMHQFGAIDRIAQLVLSAPAGVLPDVRSTEIELATKAGLAVLVLVITTTLSVYKPWGLTPYGRRIQQRRGAKLNDGASDQVVPFGPGDAAVRRVPIGLKIFLALTVLLVLVIVILGHDGGHLGHHLGGISHLHHHS